MINGNGQHTKKVRRSWKLEFYPRDFTVGIFVQSWSYHYKIVCIKFFPMFLIEFKSYRGVVPR